MLEPGCWKCSGNSGKWCPAEAPPRSSGPSLTNSLNSWWAYHPPGITGPTVACAGDPFLFSANTSTTVSRLCVDICPRMDRYQYYLCIECQRRKWRNHCGNNQLHRLSLFHPNNSSNCKSHSGNCCWKCFFPPTVCSGNTFAVNVSGAATYTVDHSSITGTSPFTLTGVIGTQYSVTGTSAAGCINQTAVPHTNNR